MLFLGSRNRLVFDLFFSLWTIFSLFVRFLSLYWLRLIIKHGCKNHQIHGITQDIQSYYRIKSTLISMFFRHPIPHLKQIRLMKDRNHVQSFFIACVNFSQRHCTTNIIFIKQLNSQTTSLYLIFNRCLIPILSQRTKRRYDQTDFHCFKRVFLHLLSIFRFDLQ